MRHTTNIAEEVDGAYNNEAHYKNRRGGWWGLI